MPNDSAQFYLEMEDDFLTLHTTSHARGTERKKLRRWEPWRHRIDFDNGLSTKDFKRLGSHLQNTHLNKFPVWARSRHPLRRNLWLETTRYWSATPVTTLSMRQRNTVPAGPGIHTSVLKHHRNLCAFCRGSGWRQWSNSVAASAETFSRPEEFECRASLRLRFIIFRIQDSLRATFDNLRRGGYLAREDTRPQSSSAGSANILLTLCTLLTNERTNFWALSPSVLTKCLELVAIFVKSTS